MRKETTPLTAVGKLNPPPMDGVLARSPLMLEDDELPDRDCATFGCDVCGRAPAEADVEAELGCAAEAR